MSQDKKDEHFFGVCAKVVFEFSVLNFTAKADVAVIRIKTQSEKALEK